jgi:hypothetical protein
MPPNVNPELLGSDLSGPSNHHHSVPVEKRRIVLEKRVRRANRQLKTKALRMEKIPRPLAEPQELFPLLCSAHVLSPVVLAAATAAVVSSHSECCPLRFGTVESGRRAAVIALVFVPATSSSCGRSCASKVWSCGCGRRVEIVVCARNGVCATDGCSMSSWRHWRRRSGRLHATVMNNFGFQLITAVCK